MERADPTTPIGSFCVHGYGCLRAIGSCALALVVCSIRGGGIWTRVRWQMGGQGALMSTCCAALLLLIGRRVTFPSGSTNQVQAAGGLLFFAIGSYTEQHGVRSVLLRSQEMTLANKWPYCVCWRGCALWFFSFFKWMDASVICTVMYKFIFLYAL